MLASVQKQLLIAEQDHERELVLHSSGAAHTRVWSSGVVFPGPQPDVQHETIKHGGWWERELLMQKIDFCYEMQARRFEGCLKRLF